MIKSVFVLIALSICISSFGQDTIRVEPRISYSSQEVHQLTTKGFQGNYGQENIIYSKDHIRVEYCYYEDHLRNCIGIDYKIENDSILVIGDFHSNFPLEKWNYQKLENGNYQISNVYDGIYQSGEMEQLVPLKAITPIYCTTLNRRDTLWTKTYRKEQHQPGYWDHQFYQSKIDGKIYEYDDIDDPPTQLNGHPLGQVTIASIKACLCAPMTDISTVALIISKEGRIINVDQAIGGLSDACPDTMQEIIKEIYSWGRLQPAIKKEQKVNVRWFVSIENLEREYLHPAFEDSKKARKRYIKRQKKNTAYK